MSSDIPNPNQLVITQIFESGCPLIPTGLRQRSPRLRVSELPGVCIANIPTPKELCIRSLGWRNLFEVIHVCGSYPR